MINTLHGVEGIFDERFEIERKKYEVYYNSVMELHNNLTKHIQGITFFLESLNGISTNLQTFSGEENRVVHSDRFVASTQNFKEIGERYLLVSRQFESNLKQIVDFLLLSNREINERDHLAMELARINNELKNEHKKPPNQQLSLAGLNQRLDSAKQLYERRNDDVMRQIRELVHNRNIHNDYVTFLYGLSTYFQSSAQIYAPLASDVARTPAPVIPPFQSTNVPGMAFSGVPPGVTVGGVPPTLPSRSAPPIPSRQLQARVLYAFRPETSTELALNVGDIVLITNNSHSEWWTGTCNGRSGEFPANYVQLM